MNRLRRDSAGFVSMYTSWLGPARRRKVFGRRDSAGFVSMYTAAVMVALVGLVGITLDSGRLFRQTSDSFGLAAAAARAGAQELDERHAVLAGEAVIDEAAADAAVRSYVRQHLANRSEGHGAAIDVDGAGVSVSVEEGTQITVTITGTTDFVILPFPSRTFRVSAVATAHQGSP